MAARARALFNVSLLDVGQQGDRVCRGIVAHCTPPPDLFVAARLELGSFRQLLTVFPMQDVCVGAVEGQETFWALEAALLLVLGRLYNGRARPLDSFVGHVDVLNHNDDLRRQKKALVLTLLKPLNLKHNACYLTFGRR